MAEPAARAQALERANALTVPTTRDEEWRFTDISPADQAEFSACRRCVGTGDDGHCGFSSCRRRPCAWYSWTACSRPDSPPAPVCCPMASSLRPLAARSALARSDRAAPRAPRGIRERRFYPRSIRSTCATAPASTSKKPAMRGPACSCFTFRARRMRPPIRAAW